MIQAGSVESLESYIGEMINTGYEPWYGPLLRTFHSKDEDMVEPDFYQAMVKYACIVHVWETSASLMTTMCAQCGVEWPANEQLKIFEKET